MKRVLVTGGAGFIGSHLCDHLLAMGCEVLAFDNLVKQVHPLSPKWPSYLLDAAEDGTRAEWVEQEGLSPWFGDVRDQEAVFSALMKFQPDTVIHLAALVGVAQGNAQIANYTSANVTGTAILLNCLVDYNNLVDQALASEAFLNEPRPEVVPQLIEDPEHEDAVDGYRPETQQEAEDRYTAWEIEQRINLAEMPKEKVLQVFAAGSMSSYGEGAYVANKARTRGVAPRKESALAAGEFNPAMDWPHSGDPSLIEPEGLSEVDELRPSSVYAWTKAETERLALMVGSIHGLDVRVGRFFNCYGDRQALSNPYTGVGAIFASRALAGLAPRVYEDGQQLRDFIHVSDLCSGIIAILEKGEGGEVYNIGTGNPATIEELAAHIADELGAPAPEITGQFRSGDIRSAYADTYKISGLGWGPLVSIERGVTLLCDWVKEQSVESVDHDAAHRDLLQAGLLKGGE